MIKQNLEPINIMLADNNPLILSGMSDIFDRDPRFSLVATSATAEGFLGMVMRVPVEIGVIDWQLPVLGGAKLIEVLRDQEHAPRLVIYGDDSWRCGVCTPIRRHRGFAIDLHPGCCRKNGLSISRYSRPAKRPDPAIIAPRTHDPRSVVQGDDKSRIVQRVWHLDQHGQISPVKPVR